MTRIRRQRNARIGCRLGRDWNAQRNDRGKLGQLPELWPARRRLRGHLVAQRNLKVPTIQLNGSLEIASDTTPSPQINFASGAKLTIDSAASFVGPALSNFTVGDILDIKNFSATGVKLSYNASTGVAQISNGSQTATLNFKTSTLGAGAPQVASDGGTGVVLTLSQAPPPAAPTIASPVNGSTDTTTTPPTISGTGIAGDIVSVTSDGGAPGTTTVQASGVWSSSRPRR
jgi:hypothetical protein